MSYPDGTWPPMDNQNIAASGAAVGQQNAVNYGDTAFHVEAIYHVNQGDPPERRNDVARNFLAAGVPREAERLFGDLLREGHVTSERAYYYALSVVSGRSCGEVGGELFKNVRDARKIAQSLPDDPWQEAFTVVWRLLHLVRDEAGAHRPRENLDQVLDAFGSLPPDRQDEITQHLATIQDGVTQAALEGVYAHRVVAQRMSNGRVQRAWKFFEPEPAPPRPFIAAETKPEQKDWLPVFLGGAATLIGLLNSFAATSLPGVLLALPMIIGGAVLMIHHGAWRAGATMWGQIRLSQVAPPPQQPEPRSPGHWVSTAFVREVHRIVDSRFTEARPHVAGDWPTYTAGIRAHLKRRFVDLYGNAQVPAGAVSWLARWHARKVAEGWDSNALFHTAVRSPERDTALHRVGIGATVAGMVVLVAAGGMGAVLFLAPGCYFAVKAVTRIRGLSRMSALARAHDEQIFAAEQQGYEEWVRVLADRPSDSEMARWLSLDKVCLKNDLVRRNNLTTHDLVTHVVMTEGANGAKRARVLHGPPRYSHYEVQIFLLTRSGVRETRVELNFLTGEARNERRNLFRYDALASASVTEVGLRATHGEGDGAREVERLRSRRFCLTLVNGRDITVVAENFRNSNDSLLEDESELFLVALQTSGIDAALPILEAVAAEGSDWIDREQERRERWSRDWYE
ncbi:hypothetical protein [Lentzea jiangxiensis]|uniref:Uncharacterized protein n=1 Tax=Lentzea jiangxiensis TaxID=641025 RepID=A0A1H0SEC7_9PSEU|nr:hypothetical protein [Lentzea jiangxiensis]SDP40025.1 hypothetical protein SAMN05421507_10823 [Lentzea jiangxiensis]